LHENLLKSLGVKTCESAIASDGTINVLIGTFKKMRTDQIENAINRWNDGQSSKQMQISIQHVFGYNTIDTFGKDIGTRASDHPFVWAIGTARDNKNPSYHFWRSSDPSNAQISSKKQKTAHSARQTTVDKRVAPMVDVTATLLSVAPESVMVDVPATLLSVEVAPMADAMEEILAQKAARFAAGPARKPVVSPQVEVIVKIVTDSKDQVISSKDDVISAKNVALDAKDAVIASKDAAYADVVATKDAALADSVAALMAKDAAHAEVISAKNAAYKASIAAQAASHEAAMTARQASIDALTVSNERLRGALAAFMA